VTDEWLSFVLEIPVKWSLVAYVLWVHWPIWPK